MIKVLFFTLTLNGGGMERLLIDIVKNLDEKKYDITVQTFYDEGIYKKQLPDYVHYRSLVSYHSNILRKIKGRLLWMILPPSFVYERYIKSNYDIEIAFVEGVPIKLLGLKNKTCKKRIAWVHADLMDNHYTSSFFKSINKERDAFQCFDKIVCVSESALIGFKNRFGNLKNLIVKNNFIDEEFILKKSQESLEHIPRSKKIRIISVGRLAYQKGFDRLIKVIKTIIDSGRSVELWIFGDGDQRKMLDDYIKCNFLEEYVRLWGFVENPYKYMRQCDLYVLPSRTEGFGLALAEAMLLGLPVISTRVSGPDKILDNGKYGVLVDNNEEALLNAIVKLYDDEKLLKKYSDLSIARVSYFTKKQRMKEIEELFI